MRIEIGALKGNLFDSVFLSLESGVFSIFVISGSSEDAAQKSRVSWSRLIVRGISPVRACRASSEVPCCVRVTVFSD